MGTSRTVSSSHRGWRRGGGVCVSGVGLGQTAESAVQRVAGFLSLGPAGRLMRSLPQPQWHFQGRCGQLHASSSLCSPGMAEVSRAQYWSSLGAGART